MLNSWAWHPICVIRYYVKLEEKLRKKTYTLDLAFSLRPPTQLDSDSAVVRSLPEIMTTRRIDVHAHFVPEFWRNACVEADTKRPLPVSLLSHLCSKQ